MDAGLAGRAWSASVPAWAILVPRPLDWWPGAKEISDASHQHGFHYRHQHRFMSDKPWKSRIISRLMLPFDKARTFFVLQIGFEQFSQPIGQSDPHGHSEVILFITVGHYCKDTFSIH